MAMASSFLFSSQPFLAPLRQFTFWTYACLIYKQSHSPDHSRNPEGFVSLHRLTCFFPWHHIQKKWSLSYFPETSLLLASLKTCLLLLRHQDKPSFIHPAGPSHAFGRLVFMLLKTWQFETHSIHPNASSKCFYSWSHHWKELLSFFLVYSDWKMSITFS